MARSDNTASLFTTQLGAAATKSDFGWHQGLVLDWNSSTGQNTISIAGAPIHNVPVLTSAGLVALDPGDPVGILRYKSVYFIIGRIVGVHSGLVEPQWPIVLYPLFRPNGEPGSTGYTTVNADVLTTWEGRIRASHPKLEVDGIWGVATGTGSVTYTVLLGGNPVGSWTPTGLEVARHGPFDIQQFIGQDWLKIEIAITANSGTGERAFQPLGVYFRQT